MLRNKLEKNLDQALKRLKNGENISAVLSNYPQSVQKQLEAYLNIALTASSLPKQIAPRPLRRKLFLEHSAVKVSRFMQFMQNLKTSSAIVVALMILAVTGTVSATASSLPGDKLFTLKKVFENARVQLAQSPAEKAKLELDIAGQRLADAQQVLAQNGSDQQAKNSALQELNTQTENALNNVQAIASTPEVAKNSGLLAQAESVATNQAKFVAKVDPRSAQQTNTQIANIKNLVATANEQSGANISALKKIEVTGNVAAITNTSIIIDKNSFTFDPNLVVKDVSGNAIAITDLSLNDNVKIVGQTKDSNNIALTITLINKSKTEQNKTDVKPTPTNGMGITEPPATTQDTFGGFIVEPTIK